MLHGYDMIDGFLKDLERPVINAAIIGKSFPMIAEIPLLAKAARRRVEVLVYSADKKWWRQSSLSPGIAKTIIQLGNNTTKKGEKYKIVAMTTEKPLTQQTYLKLPDCRTRSKEIILIRR